MDYFNSLGVADAHTDAQVTGEVFPCPSCGALLPEPEMVCTGRDMGYPWAPPEYDYADEAVKCPRCGKEVLLR